jgi:hypothetical protein
MESSQFTGPRLHDGVPNPNASRLDSSCPIASSKTTHIASATIAADSKYYLGRVVSARCTNLQRVQLRVMHKLLK